MALVCKKPKSVPHLMPPFFVEALLNEMILVASFYLVSFGYLTDNVNLNSKDKNLIYLSVKTSFHVGALLSSRLI